MITFYEDAPSFTLAWVDSGHHYYLTWSWSNMLALLGSIKEKYAIICEFSWLKTKVNDGSWKFFLLDCICPLDRTQPMQVYEKSMIIYNYLYKNCKSHQLEKI